MVSIMTVQIIMMRTVLQPDELDDDGDGWVECTRDLDDPLESL